MLPTLERPVPAPLAPEPRRRRGIEVVAWTLLAITLTALLNADDLVDAAARRPFGWQRTVALWLADADHDVSHALWLDRPRRALDSWVGHEHTATPSLPPVPVVPVGPPPGPTPTAPVPPARVPPTAAHPLRVYFGGDSVAAAVSTAFARAATATHVMSTAVDYRISTGLSRPDYFNWPQRLQRVIAHKPAPQVVIVMFGANDIQPIMTPTGPANTGSAKWLAEYRRRVATLMSSLSATGTDVYWLGQPLMRSGVFTRRLNEVDTIYAEEAAHHPSITFVDTRPLLADAHGHYAAYLPDRSGRRVQVRTSDGVHLTEAGGDRVAAALLEIIAGEWQIHLHG
jgi:lysophospholipase L1-like esterase